MGHAKTLRRRKNAGSFHTAIACFVFILLVPAAQAGSMTLFDRSGLVSVVYDKSGGTPIAKASELLSHDLRALSGGAPAVTSDFSSVRGDAVMIGDRFNDVEGAHAMSVPCIGIYSGAAAPGEHEAAGADAVVHSVAELAKLFAI